MFCFLFSVSWWRISLFLFLRTKSAPGLNGQVPRSQKTIFVQVVDFFEHVGWYLTWMFRLWGSWRLGKCARDLRRKCLTLMSCQNFFMVPSYVLRKNLPNRSPQPPQFLPNMSQTSPPNRPTIFHQRQTIRALFFVRRPVVTTCQQNPKHAKARLYQPTWTCKVPISLLNYFLSLMHNEPANLHDAWRQTEVDHPGESLTVSSFLIARSHFWWSSSGNFILMHSRMFDHSSAPRKPFVKIFGQMLPTSLPELFRPVEK